MNKQKKTLKIDELLGDVSAPLNISNPLAYKFGKEENAPLVVIPKDQSYIEVLGRKFYDFNSLDGFVEYLKKFVELEEELDKMYNQRAALIDYLVEKLEYAKLMATYEDGGRIRYPSVQEKIYRDILNRVDGTTEEGEE